MENNTLAGYIITIDGGTTNTRCILWDQSRNKIAEEKRQVGVRNTAIDGNNEKLKMAVKECLDALLDKNDLTYENIRRIIASGMITSDVGIVVIPHLSAPRRRQTALRNRGLGASARQSRICPAPLAAATPMWKTRINKRSSTILIRADAARNTRGTDEFPTERRSAAK